VVIVGSSTTVEIEYYAVFEDTYYKLETVVKAFDVCFKSFHTFDFHGGNPSRTTVRGQAIHPTTPRVIIYVATGDVETAIRKMAKQVVSCNISSSA